MVEAHAPAPPSDEDLCRGVAGGQGSAFAQLHARYQTPLYHFAAGLLDPSVAADVTDGVLEQVVRQAHTLGRRRFAPWVYALAYQACRDRDRQRPPADAAGRWPARPLPLTGAAQDPARVRRRLLEELPHLDAAHRATHLLHFQHGFAVEDIAGITGCAASVAQTRMFAATRQLAARVHGLPAGEAEPGAAPTFREEER